MLEILMKFLYGRGRFLVDGSRIIVLFEWVVKIEQLGNWSTHWPVGRPIHQVQWLDRLAKNPDLLANTLQLAGGL